MAKMKDEVENEKHFADKELEAIEQSNIKRMPPDRIKRVTLRLPTKDTYAYIEVELSVFDIEEAVEYYNHSMRLIRKENGVGLPDKEFNCWLDKYLVDGTGDADQYAQMNVEQITIIQTIKRSLKRIAYPTREVN